MNNNQNIKGTYVNIKRFEIHDGDGIRTTLFLKGCPLCCKWCHNPEGINAVPQLGYYAHKCINCGECVTVCPTGAHTLEQGKHSYDRGRCIACGKCESVCLGGALVFYGKTATPKEILPKLLEDKDFYINSGGGVTISGGEPLLQADFTCELLRLLKEESINTALDTCLLADRKELDKVVKYTDTFLVDIKAADPALHLALTGMDNRLILDNFNYLNSLLCPMEVRIPYIPDQNSGEIEAIGALLAGKKAVKRVKLLSYHDLSGGKYASLDMPYALPDNRLPTEEELDNALNILRGFGLNAVR